VTVVTGLQAIGAHPQCPILEYAWREVPWRERLVIPQEKVVDSRMRLPEGPGLGVRLNMDVVEEQRLGERVTIE
jgi:L-alanine-DL-glutamate epimerase-like enolase superfamily enzyme